MVVPHSFLIPENLALKTWPKSAWTYNGAANDWTGLSLDEKRGLVFAATGSAASDFSGADRIGDDLFANSVIALKADTGERVWHFQTVKHDIWKIETALSRASHVLRSGQPLDAVVQQLNREPCTSLTAKPELRFSLSNTEDLK